ncbi:Uncharacterised protein [Chryseobacterium taihuense]|uniref:Uncharacterized protein n=1 Tax=Chryseobacterium taihuense TaxID=1141221 RepID=A0A4U8WAD4_9FLAO|nr:Uncharacterised protein [Chryseobacterium taihuense]
MFLKNSNFSASVYFVDPSPLKVLPISIFALYGVFILFEILPINIASISNVS